MKARTVSEVAGGGCGIHWPEIDEDLSTEGLLRSAPAPRGVGGMKTGYDATDDILVLRFTDKAVTREVSQNWRLNICSSG